MSPGSDHEPPPAPRAESRKVAVITGASQGIGAGLVAAFRRAGYAVVATSRSIHSSDESDLLKVPGDIAELATARRVEEQALDRFGRIDSLINNAGVFIGKPFTDYTADDYAAITAVNLDGFLHARRTLEASGEGRRRAPASQPRAAVVVQHALVFRTRRRCWRAPQAGWMNALAGCSRSAIASTSSGGRVRANARDGADLLTGALFPKCLARIVLASAELVKGNRAPRRRRPVRRGGR